MFFGKLFSSENNNLGGHIAFLNLQDWWLTSFTEKERERIIEVFQPMGASKNDLVKGTIEGASNENPLSFLTLLAGWFDNQKDRSIAYKIIAKAEEYINSENNIINLHFFYPMKMNLFYKDRDKYTIALQEAINACLKQIEIADRSAAAFKKEYKDSQLPSHEGYSQLCIILEKRGKFAEAIKFAKQAKMQGWVGDWDGRINRCLKKIEKLGKF